MSVTESVTHLCKYNTYLLDLDALKGVEWMTNLLYDAGYLFMAAALYWHNRFAVFSKKAAEKRWQESNK